MVLKDPMNMDRMDFGVPGSVGKSREGTSETSHMTYLAVRGFLRESESEDDLSCDIS